MSITVNQANRLLKKVESGLLQAEEGIKAIIAEKAWEPLGYSTFSDMWRDKLSHIELAKYLLPHIVYQMFAEGCTDENVAEVVKGIGPKTVEVMRRKRSNGVPPEYVIIREHARKTPPADDHTITVDVGSNELIEYRKIATANGLTVNEIALNAVRSEFAKLSRRVA